MLNNDEIFEGGRRVVQKIFKEKTSFHLVLFGKIQCHNLTYTKI